ncbi:MAG: RidA family protein [Bdellovibrionales bacterium]|nr:RidA family protein [Bdellovibrionales bacterium]
MSKIIHKTESAPAPVGPYSQAVEINNVIYCSGQIALDAASGQLVEGNVQVQTKKVMDNIGAVLESCGLSYRHIVKTMIFVKDMNDFGSVNEVYAQYFQEAPPARSCVEAARLPKDVSVEIEVIAHREA